MCGYDVRHRRRSTSTQVTAQHCHAPVQRHSCIIRRTQMVSKAVYMSTRDDISYWVADRYQYSDDVERWTMLTCSTAADGRIVMSWAEDLRQLGAALVTKYADVVELLREYASSPWHPPSLLDALKALYAAEPDGSSCSSSSVIPTTSPLAHAFRTMRQTWKQVQKHPRIRAFRNVDM